MELTKREFDILKIIIENDEALTQRELERISSYSLSTVNRILKELSDKGYISEGKITTKGRNMMESYKVKKAVILAAGFGSRLVPITLNTPKALIKVNGKRIIDGIIDALYKEEIEEIIVVRGYLKAQFDQLLEKYPNIKFIDNMDDIESNSISSAYAARAYFQNAYVIESDLILNNPKLISKYQYTSNFLGIKKERSDDWCFQVKDGQIKEVSFGGLNVYQMVGISYWSKEDGKKLEEDLKKGYLSPGGKERFFEQVPLNMYKNNYNVAIRECKESDVIEIDTYKELKNIDRSYEV